MGEIPYCRRTFCQQPNYVIFRMRDGRLAARMGLRQSDGDSFSAEGTLWMPHGSMRSRKPG